MKNNPASRFENSIGQGIVTAVWTLQTGEQIVRVFKLYHKEQQEKVVKLLQFASHSGISIQFLPGYVEVNPKAAS